MTPHFRTEGPIGGHLPRTDKPTGPRQPRFVEGVRSETEQDWRKRSACRDEDPDAFFAVGTGAAAELQTANAKKICARCEVIAECGIFLAHMQNTLPGVVEGVWAGTSLADRERENRREQRARDRSRQRARRQAAA